MKLHCPICQEPIRTTQRRKKTYNTRLTKDPNGLDHMVHYSCLQLETSMTLLYRDGSPRKQNTQDAATYLLSLRVPQLHGIPQNQYKRFKRK